jgi:hypothetical protein
MTPRRAVLAVSVLAAAAVRETLRLVPGVEGAVEFPAARRNPRRSGRAEYAPRIAVVREILAVLAR